jgi:hypothetical protein
LNACYKMLERGLGKAGLADNLVLILQRVG